MCSEFFTIIVYLIKKKSLRRYLTNCHKYEKIDLSNPYQRKSMSIYKVQREYTNWEEIIVEAESEEDALAQAEDDESLWEYAYDVNSYNYTGETWVGE
jgi:hypothetical protein